MEIHSIVFTVVHTLLSLSFTEVKTYRFTPVIGPVRVYTSPGLGVDKILSFVYFPTGAICETGGGGICETGELLHPAQVFQLRRGKKVDDSIGWERAFEDTHTPNFTRKKDLGKQVK